MFALRIYLGKNVRPLCYNESPQAVLTLPCGPPIGEKTSHHSGGTTSRLLLLPVYGKQSTETPLLFCTPPIFFKTFPNN